MISRWSGQSKITLSYLKAAQRHLEEENNQEENAQEENNP